MSEHTSFEIDGDFLVISHEDQFDRGEVVISEDGGLTVNQLGVETDGRSRRLLRRFFREAARLEERTERLTEDADGLVAEAAAYATAALRSLAAGDGNGEQDGPDFDERLEDVEFDEDNDEQNEKLRELAEELRDRIPELAELDWFLDT